MYERKKIEITNMNKRITNKKNTNSTYNKPLSKSEKYTGVRGELAKAGNKDKLTKSKGRKSFVEIAVEHGVYEEIADCLMEFALDNPFYNQKELMEYLIEQYPEVFEKCNTKYANNFYKNIMADSLWEESLAVSSANAELDILRYLHKRAKKGLREVVDKDGKIYEVGMKDKDAMEYVKLLWQREDRLNNQNNINNNNEEDYTESNYKMPVFGFFDKDVESTEYEVNMSNLVCDTFHEVYQLAVDCEIDRLVLKGGRSSTKSQCVSEIIIDGCMTYKTSAVCLLKHANKIEERLVNTFRASMDYMGVSKYWKLRKSPYEYVLLDEEGKETDISIKFTGCDDPNNIKSFKPRKGSFRYIWFEELTNFKNFNEVENIIQTMARGEGEHCTFMTYNPEKRMSNWTNQEYGALKGKYIRGGRNCYEEEIKFELDGVEETIKQIVHHSTYLDVIDAGHSDWLGKSFIAGAEQKKETNNVYYRWAYLGEVIGTDANVFSNIVDWTFTTDRDYPKINRGLDCSNGGPDPWAYGEWFYDKSTNSIYSINERHFTGSSTISQVAMGIKRLNTRNRTVFIDSAVPTFRRMLIKEGLNIVPAKKGNDSVEAGVEWLRSLDGIYIDPIKCPNTYREFKGYEWFIDKDDNITSELVDENNHFIDETRYAFNVEILY